MRERSCVFYVCVRVCEIERVCTCVFVLKVCMCVSLLVCVCVCVRESVRSFVFILSFISHIVCV